MTRYRPGAALEVLVTYLGHDDIDEIFVDLRIVDAGELAAHQLGGVDRHVEAENSPSLLRPHANLIHAELPIVKREKKWMVQPRVAVLHLFHEKLAELLSPNRPLSEPRIKRHY